MKRSESATTAWRRNGPEQGRHEPPPVEAIIVAPGNPGPPPHRRGGRPRVPPLALAAVVACLAGCTRGTESRAAPGSATADALPLAVVDVTPRDLEAVVELTGSLAPRARVGIAAKMPGTLERIAVELGDRVEPGDTIATLDRRDVDAQVDAAEAAVNVARAALAAAEAGTAHALLEVERARTLFEKGALPRQRLDAAETAQRSATAQRDLATAGLAQAEASRRRAREALRDTTLTAPIGGLVVERHHDVGALVGRGEPPVAVVADSRTLKLTAGVSELEAGRLRPGLPAVVTASARPGRQYRGRIAAVAPEVDARNRQFRVEIHLDNPEQELLPGMFAVARVVVGQAAGALAVPREAVTSRDGRRVVYRVEGDALCAVPVTEGLIGDTLVQIVSGLAVGDRVVTDARREHADGTRVRPILENR